MFCTDFERYRMISTAMPQNADLIQISADSSGIFRAQKTPHQAEFFRYSLWSQVFFYVSTCPFQRDPSQAGPICPAATQKNGLTRSPYIVEMFGAGTKSRTRDLRFTKPLLYQLSYAGFGGANYSHFECPWQGRISRPQGRLSRPTNCVDKSPRLAT